MPTSDADPSEDFLLVDRVGAGYGGSLVIHDVTVSIARGEVVAVIGPNGAGKSTLLKAIIGAIRVSEGTVSIAGERISGRRPDQICRMGVGYVPQERDVFPKLTVMENLEMGAYVTDAQATRERLEEVLTLFPHLAAMRRRRAGNLSGGERKMLAVGRALMSRPSLILLDEPTANLSPILAKEFLHEHVHKLASDGTAVLIVEQRATEALNVSARAYLMAAGTVALAASSRHFLEHDDIGVLFLGHEAASVG